MHDCSYFLNAKIMYLNALTFLDDVEGGVRIIIIVLGGY
jgi:hypothetical protein